MEENKISVGQAETDFRQVEQAVSETGQVFIYENNQPKYFIADISKTNILADMTENEMTEIIAKRILHKYLPAFEELAK